MNDTEAADDANDDHETDDADDAQASASADAAKSLGLRSSEGLSAMAKGRIVALAAKMQASDSEEA